MLLVALLCATAAAAPQPVAVAPWRNLSNDSTLRWLEAGVAETMTADLKAGGLAVVERAQLQSALDQIGAQGQNDVERAVAAGRLIGARSIVVGSFQRVGAQLRLVARVVRIETGEVTDAAKATGAVDDVFALQDEVVRALLGVTVKRPSASRRGETAAAYRRFGQSLPTPGASPSTTATSPSAAPTLATSPASTAALLDVLVLDPEFSYAADALDALEARLRQQTSTSADAVDERGRSLLAVVEAPAEPIDRRRAAAHTLIDGLVAARRWHGVVAAADRVVAAGIVADVIDDVAEAAAAARVLALLRLMRTDAGLAAGERYLQAFTAGNHRADVERALHDAVAVTRSEATRRREFRDELAELATDVVVAGDAADADQRRSFAFKPCIAAKWSTLPREMIVSCRRYLSDHSADTGRGAVDATAAARAYVAWGHAMLGEFGAARESAAALERTTPGALDDTGLRSVMDRWATD